MERGEGGLRCGRVEDSTIVWHSGCLATGTGQGRGLQCWAAAAPGPRPGPLPREAPSLGQGTQHLPCLSFPLPRSTLHPNAWQQEARAGGGAIGEHPTTNTHHQLWGPAPRPVASRAGVSPQPGVGDRFEARRRGRVWGQTDRPGVWEVMGAIASPPGRRVWWLLGSAELVVAVGPQMSPQGQPDSPRPPAHLAARAGRSPPPGLPPAPAPPAQQPRPSWPRQPSWWHHRSPNPFPRAAHCPASPSGLPAPGGTCHQPRPQPQWSQRPGRRPWPSPRPRWPPALPAPRGPDTPPAEPSRGLGLSLFSSPAGWCQPHCRTAAGSPSAAMERAPNLVGDCTATQGSRLIFFL